MQRLSILLKIDSLDNGKNLNFRETFHSTDDKFNIKSLRVIQTLFPVYLNY